MHSNSTHKTINHKPRMIMKQITHSDYINELKIFIDTKTLKLTKEYEESSAFRGVLAMRGGSLVFLRANCFFHVQERFPTTLFLLELTTLGLSKSESEFEVAMRVFYGILALNFDENNNIL